MDYKQKYLKYKSKYLALQQIGGAGAGAGARSEFAPPHEDEFDDKVNWKYSIISTTSTSATDGSWIIGANYDNKKGRNFTIAIYQPNKEMSDKWVKFSVGQRMVYAQQMLDKYILERRRPFSTVLSPDNPLFFE